MIRNIVTVELATFNKVLPTLYAVTHASTGWYSTRQGVKASERLVLINSIINKNLSSDRISKADQPISSQISCVQNPIFETKAQCCFVSMSQAHPV